MEGGRKGSREGRREGGSEGREWREGRKEGGRQTRSIFHVINYSQMQTFLTTFSFMSNFNDLLFAASLVFHFTDIAVRLTVSSANRIEVDGKFFGTFTKWRSTSSQRQAKTVIFTLENMTSICKGIKIPS